MSAMGTGAQDGIFPIFFDGTCSLQCGHGNRGKWLPLSRASGTKGFLDLLCSFFPASGSGSGCECRCLRFPLSRRALSALPCGQCLFQVGLQMTCDQVRNRTPLGPPLPLVSVFRVPHKCPGFFASVNRASHYDTIRGCISHPSSLGGLVPRGLRRRAQNWSHGVMQTGLFSTIHIVHHYTPLPIS